MAYLNTTSASDFTFGASFAAMQHKIVTRIMRGHHYRQTLKSLSTLSSTQLADLGLSRADLPRVASESARKATS